MLTIITFVIVLGVLVFVHEFGHFLAAKKQGIGVEEFGFGFPPRIFGVQKKQQGGWQIIKGREALEENAPTVYSLNWIPLGGFVKIKGESGEKEREKDSFASRGVGQRVLVIVMGVVFNLLLAVLLISFGYLVGMPQAVDENISKYARVSEKRIEVLAVVPDSPAEKAGIKEGDAIESINGQKDLTVKSFQNLVAENIDKEVNVALRRQNEVKELRLTPIVLKETQKPGLGVGLAQVGVVSYPWWLALPKGAVMTGTLTKAILQAFGALIHDLALSEKIAMEVAGPVGIAVMTGQAVRLGLIYLLQFVAILSINLAIINILPLPALDGGRLLFLLIEKIRRRPVGYKIELVVHNLGFILLLALVVLITYRDLARYWGTIGGWLQKLI